MGIDKKESGSRIKSGMTILCLCSLPGMTEPGSGSGRRGALLSLRHSGESRNPGFFLFLLPEEHSFSYLQSMALWKRKDKKEPGSRIRSGMTEPGSGSGRRGSTTLSSSFRRKPESRFLVRHICGVCLVEMEKWG